MYAIVVVVILVELRDVPSQSIAFFIVLCCVLATSACWRWTALSSVMTAGLHTASISLHMSEKITACECEKLFGLLHPERQNPLIY